MAVVEFEFQGDPQIPKDHAAIREVVENYEVHQGLTVEILYTAMEAIQSNPELTVEQAIRLGVDEWVR